jgi:hypothetical protein
MNMVRTMLSSKSNRHFRNKKWEYLNEKPSNLGKKTRINILETRTAGLPADDLLAG